MQLEYFKDLSDPRIERTQHHQLADIIGIAICAVLVGAEGLTDIERFDRAKHLWRTNFHALSNGFPSHDTFECFFATLDPSAFH